jgi:hypothetical protein
MAHAPAKKSSADQRSKKKLLAAGVLLLLSLSWIVYYMSSQGGAPAKPSEQEVSVINAQHEKELEEVKKEDAGGYRGKTKPPIGSS